MHALTLTLALIEIERVRVVAAAAAVVVAAEPETTTMGMKREEERDERCAREERGERERAEVVRAQELWLVVGRGRGCWSCGSGRGLGGTRGDEEGVEGRSELAYALVAADTEQTMIANVSCVRRAVATGRRDGTDTDTH